jgi:hypothetical protein
MHHTLQFTRATIDRRKLMWGNLELEGNLGGQLKILLVNYD